MRSVAVVVLHENVDDAFKMLVVQNQQPVKTLCTNGAHEPFRHAVRLRCPKRRPNNLEPDASKHFVKAVSEFLVSVANQEPERLPALFQRPRQLPGLLSHPQRVRICGAARDVDTAAV